MRRIASLSTALVLGALAACGGTRAHQQAADPTVDVPPPWTEEFTTAGTLIANTIVVEGPAGLRGHCAGQQDESKIDYELSTTDRGLVQTFTLVAGSGGTEIRGWIDRWELFAFEKLVIVERPTRGGEVVVRAIGDVVFAGPGGETRAPSFERRARAGR
ncbi:MAG: hypothetical protein R3F34_16355 [Planctomycetota bacterium]